MNKNAMLRKIHAYDFAILEFGMYLDTHPWDSRALSKRQALQAERKELIREYERRFGPYIVRSTQVKGNRWSWIDDPWPWEYNKEGDAV